MFGCRGRHHLIVKSAATCQIVVFMSDERRNSECKEIRRWSIRFALLATGSVTGVTMKSVLNIMQGFLPYRVWLPYNTNVTVIFWITSVHQMVAIILATIVNVATETLVFGFFLQTCAQLDILGSRFRKLKTNNATYHQKDISPSSNAKKSIISQHIRHHISIYNFAKTVNFVYNQVLFIQFSVSILVLCTSLYYISTHFTETESATMLVYVFCMFVQIFLYCWSGNEVILKSMNIGDAAYNMDWPLLSISEKKDLLMIMRRSTVPIRFSSSFLITLSLESYCNILKTSYSAFNVLQQS
ncbi:odorant receptor 4-like [Odontomachus brunneus]|uniref:odorant receptor 4-like n=1 Tax=Odontomachus brunneus TaxID=486640 RepID=UPI0013F21019|nr:odorant receptor 4-like [Odontomachus brunneus]